jgi:hypothetical protein
MALEFRGMVGAAEDRRRRRLGQGGAARRRGSTPAVGGEAGGSAGDGGGGNGGDDGGAVVEFLCFLLSGVLPSVLLPFLSTPVRSSCYRSCRKIARGHG